MDKIGTFARKNGVRVATLRYYDEIDLLKPAFVDQFTGYRFYDEKSQSDYDLIQKYKKAGFSLEEIKMHWSCFTELVFMEKRKELYEKIKETQSQIKYLDCLREELDGHIKIIGGKNNEFNK